MFTRHRTLLFAVLVIIIAAAFKLWLFQALSIGIIANSPHDDLLFIKLADSILSGQWLGKFNNLTLAKGPFYPIFIALSHIMGIPLLVSQQVLYIIACVVAAMPFGFLVKKQRLGIFILCFLLLLFNPFSFDGNSNLRVLRSAVYQSLSLLTVGCCLNTLILFNNDRHRQLYTAFLFLEGMFFSLSWLTREETIWLFVPIILMWACLLWISIKRRRILFGTISIVITVISFFTFLAPVLILNKIYYHHYIITEFQHPAFISAYGSLTRVKSERFIPYVPVPKNVRESIAKVSQSFAILNIYFNRDIGRNWAINTREVVQLENNEFDIGVGWFTWALRDAVQVAGYYNTLSDSIAFYEQLAQEINDACDRRELDCIGKRNTFIPPRNNKYFFNVLPYSKLFIEKLLFMKDIWPSVKEGREPYSNYLLFQKITRETPHIFSEADIRVKIIMLIIKIYRTFFTPFLFISIIIYILHFFKSDKSTQSNLSMMMVLIVFSGIVALSTILILKAVVSYEPYVDTQYIGPIPPLLFMIVMLMMVSGWEKQRSV